MDRMDRISIIAHRGRTATVKFENTIEAFQKAIEIGIPQIEFDIRMSQDGYLIVYHDQSIDDVQIEDLPYCRLQSIARSKGFEIPLFEDLLKLCSNSQDKLSARIGLDIEIKGEGYEDRVVAMTVGYFRYADFAIKSFNDASVRKIKDLDPEIKAGLLLGKITGRFPLLSVFAQFFPEYRIFKTKADFVGPHFRLLKFGFLWRMKLLKKEVYVWTVNEESRLTKLIKSKYISGIITDKPELALEIREALLQQID